MKFSTGLPNCREGRQNPIGSVDVSAITRQAIAADEAGFYSLWPNEFFSTIPTVADAYADPPNLYDCMISMAYAACVTKRIRFTPSTLVLPLHEPVALARQIATLDSFSGGRVTVGIGLGGDKDDFQKLRKGIADRSKLIEEIMASMELIWTERRATFKGQYIQFEDVESYPKPVQKPVPAYRAGHGEGVFKWIAKHGHGWIDSQFGPDEMMPYIDKLKKLVADAGRRWEEMAIARQWYVAIAETEDEAKQIFAASLPPRTKPAKPAPDAPAKPGRGPGGAQPRATTAEERTLVGTPAAILEKLRKYEKCGLTEMCVIFYSPNADSAVRQTRLFANEVMARW